MSAPPSRDARVVPAFAVALRRRRGPTHAFIPSLVRLRVRLLTPLLALGLTCAGLTGCTSDHTPAAHPSPSASPQGTAAASTLRAKPAPLKVSITHMAGHLSLARRHHLKTQAGRSIDHWFRAGFLDGPYPRHGFPDAFSTFTPGAAERARHDRQLTTNIALAPHLDSVVAKRRLVKLSVFAPRGRAVGVTAAVTLVVLGAPTSGRPTEVAVSGRLYLTRSTHPHWSVFGYDLSRAVGPPRSHPVHRLRPDRVRAHHHAHHHADNARHEGHHRHGGHHPHHHKAGGQQR